MNKKRIKNFAIHARKKLIEGVKEKALLIGIKQEKVIEEASYSYFILFITLRYMEVNHYLPEELCIFLHINKYKNEDAFKDKLIKVSCKLSEMFPFIFKPISDDMLRLFPDICLIQDILNPKNIYDKDWREVEIIGWLYQYYFSQRHKDVVGINNSRIKKEDVAVATQLFTPKWIVKYMVDNTLGKLWIENTKDGLLEEKLKFYIKQEKTEKGLKRTINPEDIKVLDPACGTGHILVYAFDVLYNIYLHEGYEEKDIPKTILKYNLYGLDIDEKAVQLAIFALIMKARERDEDFFNKIQKEKIIENLCCIEETNLIMKYKDELLFGLEDIEYAEKQIDNLLKTCYDAKEYGSIIQIKDFDEIFWNERLKCLKNEEIKNILYKIIRQIRIMNQKYDVVIANPPYLSNKMMSLKLKQYVDKYFKDYGRDLFSVFIKKNLDYTKENGYAAFMTPFVWMFIKRYEKLRKYIIEDKEIVSLIQLEYSSFEGAIVPICTFVLKNDKDKVLGDFIKLSDFKGVQIQPLKVLEAIKNKDVGYRYRRYTKSFEKIPGMPIAYWASDYVKNIFQKGIPLKLIADARVGLQTSDNKKFVRRWHEVDKNRIGFGFKDIESAKNSGYKWFPYNKGGDFRKWYGNHTCVVNWENDGEEIRAYNKVLNASRDSNVGIANTTYYFKKGITWSFVSSAKFGVRVTEEGFLFDTAGSSIFPMEEQIYFLIALLCSKVTCMYLMILNPTLNFQPGNIAMLPVLFPNDLELKRKINDLSKECIDISKIDWNSYEYSWDFQKHPFLIHKKSEESIESAFENWRIFTEKQFEKLKENEEKLNNIFIHLYNIEKDVTHNVDNKDITIKKGNRKREVRSFLSYAVGCMVGRYSLDKEGLIFAGGEFDEKNYISFLVEEDGIIPIVETENFENNIVLRLIEFVKITFGESYLNENLMFIADALGRKEESPTKCIEKYFKNDFYKEHVKGYKKRPIYWLFKSGKNKAFQCLVYMYRIDKDTIYKIREKYLKKIIETKNFERENMIQKLYEEGYDNKKVQKKKIYIEKLLNELNEYDQVLKEIENMNIEINLDDGVCRNYQKFEKVLEKI